MHRALRLLFLSALIAIFAASNPTRAEESDQNPEAIQKSFQIALANSIAQLRKIEAGKKYKLRSINDSIRSTIRAADALMQYGSYQQSERLLKEALDAYPENIIAALILADVFESQGKQQEANRAYEQFLKEGEKASQLTNDVTSFEARAAFAAYVREKLAAQQIFPPKPRGYSFLPLSLRLQTGEKSWLLSFVAGGLPMLMVVTSIIFILRKIFNLYEPNVALIDKIVFGLFMTFLSAYILWSLHLFLNLPPLIKPVEYEILALVCIGISLSIFNVIMENRRKEERFKSDPTLQKCPHCKRYIEKLMVICPVCNREIKD